MIENFIIPAETHDDNYNIEVAFDAAEWFAQTSDKEIYNLYTIGWGGDYAADAVAEFFQGKNDKIDEMFHCIYHCNGKEVVGFECHVEEESATTWIK